MSDQLHMYEWYDEIDPKVRPTVTLLRNYGFNTTNSSDRTMTIEVDFADMEDVERMATILVDHGYANFRIESVLMAPPDGFWIRRGILYLGRWHD